MRTILLIGLLASVTGLKAQIFQQGGFINNGYTGRFGNNIQLNDSSKKRWSFIKYSGISSQYAFLKGGNAMIVSAPIGMQLNLRLNNNLYAFSSVSLAPAYVNFNRSFITDDFNKANQNNAFFKSGNVGMYSRAALGLLYINDEKTFSISGSIGVERSSYPVLQNNHMNNTRTNRVISAN